MANRHSFTDIAEALDFAASDILLALGLALALILATLLPAAAQEAGNAEAGAAVFQKCTACHKVGPTARNGIGPVLNGVVGREAGKYPAYNYSPASRNSKVTWDAEALAKYLAGPKEFMPGTKMTYAGLTDPKDVANVIAYLATFDAEGNTVAGK